MAKAHDPGRKKRGVNPNYDPVRGTRENVRRAAKSALAKEPGTSLVALTNEEAFKLRMEVFCQEYIQDFNCVRSYRVATGSDYPSIHADAYLFAKRPDVKARLISLTQEKFDRLNIDSDRIITEWAKLAFFNPARYMKVNELGQPELDISKVIDDPDAMGCLDVEFGISVTKDGDKVPTYKIKTRDKTAALESLAKLKKFYDAAKPQENDRRPIVLNVSIPAPGSNWRNAQHNVVDADYTDETEGSA